MRSCMHYGRRAGLSLMRSARALSRARNSKPRPRQILRDLLRRLRPLVRPDRFRSPHEELARTILEESGHIDDVEGGANAPTPPAASKI